MSWGNTYTYKLKKVRIGQNKCIRNVFFANRSECVTPYFNLSRMLKFDNIFLLETVIFTYKIINEKGNLLLFSMHNSCLQDTICTKSKF